MPEVSALPSVWAEGAGRGGAAPRLREGGRVQFHLPVCLVALLVK